MQMPRPIRAIVAALALVGAAAATAHAIGFIESPTASCRKIKGDVCAIRWYYLSVNAAPNYMLWMRVRLGDKVVFHANGFFQTSMFVPGEQIGETIVKCGKPGTSPDPKPSAAPPTLYGNTYAYTVDARDSAGLGSANYGSVLCPPK